MEIDRKGLRGALEELVSAEAAHISVAADMKKMRDIGMASYHRGVASGLREAIYKFSKFADMKGGD